MFEIKRILNATFASFGTPGATFIPIIEETEDGFCLSWTNNRGLQNPEPVTIPKSGDVDEETIARLVEEYLAENPPDPVETDGETLVLDDGVLSVNTTGEVLEDDPRPITSGAVYDEFSKAVALLRTI